MKARVGIVLLGNLSEDSGGRTYATNLVQQLFPLDAHITVFLSRGHEQLFGHLPGLSQVLLPRWTVSTVGRLFAEQLLIPILATRIQIDVLYFPNNFLSIFCTLPSVVAIRSMLVFNVADSVDWLRLVYRKFLARESARLARGIITPSYHTRGEIQRFLPGNGHKIRVIPHGLDLSMFSPGVPTENILHRFGLTHPYILYVSSLWSYKKHDRLIEAFAKVRADRHIPHHLILVGRGVQSQDRYVEKLFELIRTERLESVVHMIDFVGHDELVHIYRGADLFVFPSETESFGHPIFEAMACGIPVVCSSSHAFPSFLGESALFANPDNTEEFARVLFEALSEKNARKVLITKGLEKARSLSWKETARQTLHVLTSSVQ